MCGLIGPVVARAQTASTLARVPPLEVISVRPNHGAGGGGMSWGATTDGVLGTNISVHLMLTQGYHLFDEQIVNEPNWARTERFDVNGKVSIENAPVVAKLSPEQKRVFFQQVLKERFGMVAHHETRELPEYALVIAKGGPRIKESKLDPDAPGGGHSKMRWGSRMSMNDGKLKFEAGHDGFGFLLQILSNETGRTIIDKTGLTGKYDYTLTWRPAMGSGLINPELRRSSQIGEAPPPPSDAVPDLFTAIQEQLGLKLEPTKGPVDVVVIDHLERPGEN